MKRHLLVGILFLLTISVLAGLAFAQTQTGKIKVVGVPDRFKSANKNQATYGIKSIGVGSRIVLAPLVYNGTGGLSADTLIAVSSATWTLTSHSAFPSQFRTQLLGSTASMSTSS